MSTRFVIKHFYISRYQKIFSKVKNLQYFFVFSGTKMLFSTHYLKTVANLLTILYIPGNEKLAELPTRFYRSSRFITPISVVYSSIAPWKILSRLTQQNPQKRYYFFFRTSMNGDRIEFIQAVVFEISLHLPVQMTRQIGFIFVFRYGSKIYQVFVNTR